MKALAPIRELTVAASALALAACGGPDFEGEVRATVESFGEAIEDRDYERVCGELLSRALVSRLDSAGVPCRVAFQRGMAAVRDPTLEIEEVDVRGPSLALVRVRTGAANQPPSTDTMRVVQEGGAWRIASLAGGGTPAPVTPAKPKKPKKPTATGPKVPPNPPAGPPAPRGRKPARSTTKP